MVRRRGEVRTADGLGRMLQQGRLIRGMSQRALAEELGIGQKWIWEMENGKPGLFTERLFQMLRATGVHLYAELDVPDDDVPDVPDDDVLDVPDDDVPDVPGEADNADG